MSLQALIWAFNQHDTTPVQRLVLLSMCNYANADDETFPSTKTIERDTGLGKSTIYKARSALVEAGCLEALDEQNHYRVVRSRPVSQGELSLTENEPSRSEKSTNTREPKTQPLAADAAGRSDDAQTLWVAYNVIIKDAQADDVGDIPPSMRRVADKALREFDLATLSGPALIGFKHWRSKKSGDTRFSSIFASHPGGRPLHDHIGFWIENAEQANPLDGLPSEMRVKVQRAVRDVQRGHGSADPDTVRQAKEQESWLREQGIEIRYRPDGYPIFPSIDPRSRPDG